LCGRAFSFSGIVPVLLIFLSEELLFGDDGHFVEEDGFCHEGLLVDIEERLILNISKGTE
jgi:hypothetical protein